MNLTKFPAPPPGKSGWPWTDGSLSSLHATLNGNDWPRVTIVTPSFNQAAYLEQTIRSILLQDYPNLEYIVMDGGSTDGSVEIIKKYERHITHWESERDGGQSRALNKAFKRATGEWVGWINSDDIYLPSALHTLMGKALADREAQWVAGSVQFVRLSTPPINEVRLQGQNRDLIDWLLARSQFHQPGALWKRSLFDRFGYLQADMQFAFDWEFWCRLSANNISPVDVERPVALFRMHESSKTCSSWDRFCSEDQKIVEAYLNRFDGADRRALVERLTSLVCTRIRHESRRLLSNREYGEMFKRVCAAAGAHPRILAKKTPYELLLYSVLGAASRPLRRKRTAQTYRPLGNQTTSSASAAAPSAGTVVVPDSRRKEESPDLPRLLYLGEVPVESSYHGSSLLYRLLCGYPVARLLIFERLGRVSISERRLPGVLYQSVPASWTIGGRLIKTYLPILFWSVWNVLGRLWAARAYKRLNGFQPDAILTVLEGSLWLGAYSLAKRLKIPLHLVLHDDPFRDIPQDCWLRRHLEKRFGGIYRSAASRFCVSPYMEELFYHRYGSGAHVLYPSRLSEMNAHGAPPVRLRANQKPFTVAYGGSPLDGGYLAALKLMADALLSHGGQLLMFGPFSYEDIAARGLDFPNVTCGGLLSSAELITRFREEADALFVPMSFDPAQRTNMTVSFPSKLADYTAAGLPLMIFGPPYCSAVKWARENRDCCELVDQSDRAALVAAIARLESDAHYRHELGAHALRIGEKFFAHSAAENLFFSAIRTPTATAQMQNSRPVAD